MRPLTTEEIERAEVTKVVEVAQAKVKDVLEGFSNLEKQACYQILWGEDYRIPTSLTHELRKLAREQIHHG